MAKRVIEVLTSDISGDEMKPGEGRTIDFSVDGTSYSIDLTDKEAQGFDKAIAIYVEHATKVSGRRSSGTSTRRSGGSGRSKEELAQVREWAQANGHEVSPRGRIKAEVLEAYDSAH